MLFCTVHGVYLFGGYSVFTDHRICFYADDVILKASTNCDVCNKTVEQFWVPVSIKGVRGPQRGFEKGLQCHLDLSSWRQFSATVWQKYQEERGAKSTNKHGHKLLHSSMSLQSDKKLQQVAQSPLWLDPAVFPGQIETPFLGLPVNSQVLGIWSVGN